MFCEKCGTSIKEGFQFCGSCGWKVSAAPVEAAQSKTETVAVETVPAVENGQPRETIAAVEHGSAAAGGPANTVNPSVDGRLKKTKNGLVAAIIIGAAAVIASNVIWYSQYSDMAYLSSRNYSLYSGEQEKYNRYYSLYSGEKEKYNRLLNNGIRVTEIQAGNSDQNYNWLTEPGKTLYANQMRFLRPVITYDSAIEGETRFYIKIFRPDGSLDTPPSSPPGYSYSSSREIKKGEGQTLSLSGWGNSDKSNYDAGVYTIEVWRNDVFLYGAEIKLE